MDNMEKTLKDALAVVGAVAVAKTVPMLAAGVAIGTVISNPEKINKAKQKIIAKCEKISKDLERESDAFNEEDLEDLFKGFPNADEIVESYFDKGKNAVEPESAETFEKEKNTDEE